MAESRKPLIRASDVSAIEHSPGGYVRFYSGAEHGFGDMTVATSNIQPGEGGGFVHRHPCGEVFVVIEGRGIYTVDGVEVTAEPGDLVVVPPNTWHTFQPAGDAPLRHVAAFDSGDVEVELQQT